VGGSVTRGRESAIRVLVRDELACGQVFSWEIIGASMSPLIRIGDQVQARIVGLDALRPGDIVVMVSPGGVWLTHRFIRWLRDGDGACLLTKGDRSLTLDPPWPPTALIGRVEVIVRDGRWLSLNQGLHRLLATLVLWEWRCAFVVNRLPGSFTRRALHKIAGWIAKCISALAWFKSTSVLGPQLTR